MQLARAAMRNLGEVVHVAVWPGVPEGHAIANRHHAMDGPLFRTYGRFGAASVRSLGRA